MNNVSSKVRAVYEALELRKNKQALKLLVPLLEKKPNNSQLRILKALALIRSGRTEEALELARALKNDKEVERDETLLNNLAIVFREGGAAAEASECFASAVRKEPNNEELALCLFGAYVRENNFLKLQQLAQNLFKQFGKDRYYLWSILATTLQVQYGSAPAKLLALTQKQLAKRAEEGKVDTYEELLLYLDICKKQGKVEEAVSLLNGPLGELYSSKVERLQTKAKLLLELECVAEARAVYEQLLDTDEGQVKGAEEWSHVRGVLECIFRLKGLPVLEDSGAPEAVCVSKVDWEWVLKEGEGVVEKLKSKAQTHARTPLLAAVELYSRLAALAHTTAAHSVKLEEGCSDAAPLAVSAMLAYIEAVGDRDVCAYDLIDPLSRLPHSYHAPLLEKALATPGAAPFPRADSDGAAKDFVGKCQQYATVIKVRQLLGGYSPSLLSKEQLLQEVDVLLRVFTLCCNKVVRIQGYPVDRSASDDAALAAARILMDLYISSGDDSLLVDAIVAARYGLSLSPTNFQFKLLLLRLYRMAGAYEALSSLFETLQVKHILHDTLSHLILPQSWEWGAVSKAKFAAEMCLRLDRDNARDSPEYTFKAFKSCTFSKIPELLAFEGKLRCSAQMAAAKMDVLVLSLLEVAGSSSKEAVSEAQAFLSTMGGVDCVYEEEQAMGLKVQILKRHLCLDFT